MVPLLTLPKSTIGTVDIGKKSNLLDTFKTKFKLSVLSNVIPEPLSDT